MKILAIGDTHGDLTAPCNIALPQAAKHDIKLILQMGDFGYWEHQEDGKRFLDKLSKHLVRRGMEMWWFDGNHENHPMLWEKYKPSGPNGFCEIRPNLWYIPRGSVFNLGHVRCVVMGGAFSIDKGSRLKREMMHRGHRVGMYSSYGVTDMLDSSIKEWANTLEGHTEWWPTEMITDEQVATAVKNLDGEPVDVMFSHDCPTGVSIPGIHSVDKWKYPETWENRDRLLTVFEAAQPKLLVHGHYHTAYTGRLPLKKEGWGCRVEGLANDGTQGFSIVLDLDQLFPVQS